MKKSIFKSICIAAAAVFIAAMVVILGALYDYFSNAQQEQLKAQTLIMAHAVENEGGTYFSNLPSGNTRVTWIGSDGNVLFDSQSNAEIMDNHLDRSEIKQALSTGYGESARYSSTLMERQLYSAQKLPDGTVIRLSSNHLSVLSLILIMMQPILVILIVAIVLSLILASRLSKRIVKPLNELNLDDPKKNQGYEELRPLLARVDSQQIQLKKQASELRRKQDEFNAATENMNEGLVLLNENGIILSINRTAAELLSISSFCVGKDILLLNNSLALQELLRKAKAGERSNMALRLSGTDYQVSASPVVSDEGISGIALLIFDITEKEKAERMRREFTANVSHELKTPLHSISGYAELLKNDMVKPEDTGRFYENIYQESQRMISLVDNIISLSRLDEHIDDGIREQTDLYVLAEETLRILRPAADAKKVTLSLSGDPAVINGVPSLLNGIIFNLCDNAVKYNRENGSVSVSVDDLENEVRLSVGDTGLGIPEEDKEHVFERFYRVDKSHSKAAGGSGLGLSIVKHAAKIHNAKIELNSVLDGGTTVTVIFPKDEAKK